MIVGLGCDLLDNFRLANVLKTSREQFLRRLCHANELKIQHINDHKELRYLCHLWCIKEACSKALGTGITSQVTLSSMEVHCPRDRSPEITLHDGALQTLLHLMQEHGGQNHRIHVSVSDDQSWSMAVAMIEIW